MIKKVTELIIPKPIGTIMENIRYDRLDADDEEVIEAAHVYGLIWS